MSRLNYAIATLAVAVASAALAPSARAAILHGVFNLPNLGYTESFDIQTTGTPDAAVDYTDFALSNDSLGNTLAIVGDDTTGFYASYLPVADSYFGTGPSTSDPSSQYPFASLTPALYSASNPNPVLRPGTYSSDFGPGSLVLTAPEPEAWVLLIAGAAMTGGALRASRRRNRAAMA